MIDRLNYAKFISGRLLRRVFAFMAKSGIFCNNLPVVAEFLVGRLDDILISVRASVFVTVNLLTIPTIFCFRFVRIDRPNIDN